MLLRVILFLLMLSILVSCQSSGGSTQYTISAKEEAEVEKEVNEEEEQEQEDVKKFALIDKEVSMYGSSVSLHRLATYASLRSVIRGRKYRHIIKKILKFLARRNVKFDQIQKVLEGGFGPRVNCDIKHKCDRNSPYRTADGSCNNLKHTAWGMESIPMRRFLYPEYGDGVCSPRQRRYGNSGPFLPSARSVSTRVHATATSADLNKKFTHMLMQWGQFLDHDFTSTPTQQIQTDKYGISSAACCEDIIIKKRGIRQTDLDRRPECFPIKIVQPDQHLKLNCMNFIRSVQVENAKCKTAPCEQMNQITAFVDASNVYGSTLKEQKELRTFSMGLLKEIENRLPNDTSVPPSCSTPRTDEEPYNYCFRAGDHRVNENPTLQSMHTVFMREHNRIVTFLKCLNPGWDDEKLFQEARKIVGAQMQVITYKEYLPLILGARVMDAFQLNVLESGYSNLYDENTDPSINNAFATAAFRFGHSMIRDTLGSRGLNYEDRGNDNLSDVFGDTSQILSNPKRRIGRYLRGLVKDRVQNVDRKLVSAVVHELFRDENNVTMDLAALNIQRGRDHGLPPYVKWRKFCGNINEVKNFRDLSDTHETDSIKALDEAYKDVNDIDLFPGALSEKPVGDSLLGPTFTCLLAKQFRALKIGDRFWFEEDNGKASFTPDQLSELRKVSLSRIICDNTPTTKIQKNAFKAERVVGCQNLPSIDLTKWRESIGTWGRWSPWGECDEYGLMYRTRKCEPCSCGCEGPNVEARRCEDESYGWSKWGPCENNKQKRSCECPGKDTRECCFIKKSNP